MGWLVWAILVVLILGFAFRNVITGMFVSSRDGGIFYLSDMLQKQYGLAHGTIPSEILGKVVDRVIELAESHGHKGSIATKGFLVEKTPQFAQLLSEWYEHSPKLEETWKSIFTEIGVPQRKDAK